MTPPLERREMDARIVALEEQARTSYSDRANLWDKKASTESVESIKGNITRLEGRVDRFSTALLTGAVAWLVGSGMFLIAVLQLHH